MPDVVLMPLQRSRTAPVPETLRRRFNDHVDRTVFLHNAPGLHCRIGADEVHTAMDSEADPVLVCYFLLLCGLYLRRALAVAVVP